MNLLCLIIWWIGFIVADSLSDYLNAKTRVLQNRPPKSASDRATSMGLALLWLFTGSFVCVFVKT